MSATTRVLRSRSNPAGSRAKAGRAAWLRRGRDVRFAVHWSMTGPDGSVGVRRDPPGRRLRPNRELVHTPQQQHSEK
jgi:hypothetical protein